MDTDKGEIGHLERIGALCRLFSLRPRSRHRGDFICVHLCLSVVLEHGTASTAEQRSSRSRSLCTAPFVVHSWFI